MLHRRSTLNVGFDRSQLKAEQEARASKGAAKRAPFEADALHLLVLKNHRPTVATDALAVQSIDLALLSRCLDGLHQGRVESWNVEHLVVGAKIPLDEPMRNLARLSLHAGVKQCLLLHPPDTDSA